jgi:hypothetical protein
MQSPFDTLAVDDPTLSENLMHMLCDDNDGPHLAEDENMGDDAGVAPRDGYNFDVNDWV